MRMHYKWYENTAVSIQGILTTIHLPALSGFYGNRGNCWKNKDEVLKTPSIQRRVRKAGSQGEEW